jgi:hypothetical protein
LIARRVFDGLKVRGKVGAKVSACCVFPDISSSATMISACEIRPSSSGWALKKVFHER